MKYQELFIERLQNSLPAGQSLAPILADLLDISMDSAYRRINCKTIFSLDETIKVAQEFDLSIDSLLDPNQIKASFIFQDLQASFESFAQYLDILHQNLKHLKATPNSHLYYSCLDIPIFLNLSNPTVGAFKIFYWMHSIMEVPELQGQVFKPEIIPVDFIQKGLEIFKTYSEIPSTELWTVNTFKSTLRQIEYYHQAGYIRDREVSEAIYDGMNDLIQRLNAMAEKGSKVIDRVAESDEMNNFKLYESDIELTGNGAIAVVGERKRSFIGHLTFHTLISDHPALNDKTMAWYEGLVRKANLISSVSAKFRYQFISHLQSEVDASRSRILANS